MLFDLFGMRIVVLERLVQHLVMLGGHEDVAHRELCGLALMRLAVAGFLVLFISLEDLLQPRHQLIDRRQRTRRALLATRPLRSYRPLRTCFAARTLRPRLALLARFALWAGLAVGPGLAAKPVRSAPSWLS